MYKKLSFTGKYLHLNLFAKKKPVKNLSSNTYDLFSGFASFCNKKKTKEILVGIRKWLSIIANKMI